MNIAYIFQEKFTGTRVYVYNKDSVDEAFNQLKIVVENSNNWIYIGTTGNY